MEIGKTANLHLMLMYVYLKAYGEAVSDFEGAVKDAGYADIALMSVKQKYREKIDRIAREMSE
jgi:hypothetical protein